MTKEEFNNKIDKIKEKYISEGINDELIHNLTKDLQNIFDEAYYCRHLPQITVTILSSFVSSGCLTVDLYDSKGKKILEDLSYLWEN